MATFELTVDTSKISETTIDDIKLAIERLSKASEEQFREIKKETWYIRLWDIVTFSKKNEIRMAEQISTLAQAQEALANILIVLSAQTEEISDLVRNHSEEIEHLYSNDTYLLKRLKDLENEVYGFSKAVNVSELSTHNKAILNTCIYYLSLKFEEESSYLQKTYASAIHSLLSNGDARATDAASAEEVLTNSLPKIEPLDARKCILTCCFEYIYLHHCDKDNFDSNIWNDIVGKSDVGQQTVKEIERMVIEAVNLRGAEGIIEKYKTPVAPIADDTFTMDLDLEEVYSVEEGEPEPLISMKQPQEFPEIEMCIRKYVNDSSKPFGTPQKATDELLQKLLTENTPAFETVAAITKAKKVHMVFTTYAAYYISQDSVVKIPYSQMAPENVRTDIRQEKCVFCCGEEEICDSNIADALKSFSQEIYRQEPKPMTDLLTPFEKLDIGVRIGYFRNIANILKEEDYPLFDLYQLVDANSFSDYWSQIGSGVDVSVEHEFNAWKNMIPYPNEESLYRKLLEDLCCTQLWTRFWAQKRRGISVQDEKYYTMLISDEEVIKEIMSRVAQEQDEYFAAINEQEKLAYQERSKKINTIIYNYERAIDTAKQAGYVDIQQGLESIVSSLKEKAATPNAEGRNSINDSFQTDELENMKKGARKVVYGVSASTAVTGAVPIPFADMPLLISQQVAMLTSIATIFKISTGKETLQALIAGAIGVSGASILGKTVVSSALKLIPGAGTVVGGAFSAGTAGILTLAMGNAAIEFFTMIKEGKLSPEDITKKAGKDVFKSIFQAQLKAAKEEKRQEPAGAEDHN